MSTPIVIPAAQLRYLQADLAITTDQTIFTDSQLDDNWTRSKGDYNSALALSIFQLLMDTAKWTDYTAGQTSERRSQTHDMLLKNYQAILANASRSKQFAILGIRQIPPRRKAKPFENTLPGGTIFTPHSTLEISDTEETTNYEG